jgi:hypothetical protein
MQFGLKDSSRLGVASPRMQTLYIVAKVLISLTNTLKVIIQEIYRENRTAGTDLNKCICGQASMKYSCCKV